MDGELRLYFPERFAETEELEFYYNLQKRIEADVEAMKDPSKEAEAEIIRRATDEYFAIINKPKNYANTKDSYIVALENHFEELVCVLEDNGCVGAKNLSTFDFFKRSEYCQRKFKAQTPG